MTSRNPIKDKVAIIGVGSTGFTRQRLERSQASLALEACVRAIRHAGVDKATVDGVVGTSVPSAYVASALGLEGVTYYTTEPTPFVSPLVQGMNAVFSGSCDVAVVYHAVYRTGATSRSAAEDVFRRGFGAGMRVDPDHVDGAVAYAAWSSRYFFEAGLTREQLGHVAVNDRLNGARNPLAVMREPITMQDYLSARMVREPLCLFDMDVPVDGADAVVVTTAERAKDLCEAPVLVHAAALGITSPGGFYGGEDQASGLDHHGQQVVVRELRSKSDLWLDSVDVYFPYDGFSFITLAWLENTGWCGRGEAGAYIASQADAEGRILLNGRVPINTHGGALSEGATQGSGHVREAVLQLRGEAGERQVPGAKTALVTPGGFFFNSQGLILRVE